MALALVTPPAAEPISLVEAKAHLRVTGSDEDGLISAYITAARDYAEAYTRRAIVVGEWDWKLDGFYAPMEPPRSPLKSVTHIKYLDSNGTEQTLATSVYRVDAVSSPARIDLDYGQEWPATRDTINAVTVRFRAGFAQPFTANASTDFLTAAAHGYVNGDVVVLSNSGGILPAGLSPSTGYFVVNKTADTLQLSLTSGGAAIDLTSAGTGTSFLGEVPAGIRHAMLLMIGELYERREMAMVGVPIVEVPFSIAALLGGHRVITF